MAQPKGLSDTDLSALVGGLIDEAVQYDTVLARKRELANQFMDGKVDIPSEPGKSSVVSQDMPDAVHTAMPALLRTFLASDRVVIYEPRRPITDPQTGKDVSAERAAQQTDYVNYTVMSECDGYRVFSSALYAGLVYGNGILKHWWDDTKDYATETRYGLSELQFTELASDPDVEVLEHTAYPDDSFTFASANPNPALIAATQPPAPDAQAGAGLPPMGGGGGAPTGVLPGSAASPPGPVSGAVGAVPNGQPTSPLVGQPAIPGVGPELAPPTMDMSMGLGMAPMTPMLHDVRIRRCVSHGRLRIKALPNEEFRIGRNATALTEDECGGFCEHVYQETRSNLVKQGFDKSKVYEAPVYQEDSQSEYEKSTRDDNYESGESNEGDDTSKKVTVHECYVLCDQDGDGIADWLQVTMVGGSGQRNILRVEPWEGDLPFTDLVPEPVPFTWAGLSLLDHTYDIQRIKTTLWRMGLNGIYMRLNPQRVFRKGALDATGMDQLANQELGAFVGIDGGPAAGAIETLNIDFDPSVAFSMMEYCDAVVEKRTGLSKNSMALDLNALQNQSATAVNAAQSAAYTKIETYARNIAEVGMRRLFRCILKLICQHQDRKRTIRLRGEWVDMDPKSFDPDMDVTINTGLGSGSRERDTAALMGVLNEQKAILQLAGPANPIAGVKQIVDTLRKLVETSGLKSPEQYFADPTPEFMQKIMNPQQAPNPEMMKVQAKIQGDQAMMQAKMQADQQKQQADFAMAQQKAGMDLQTLQKKAELEAQFAREKAAADVQIAREKAAADLQLAREKAQQDMQLRREEMQMEYALKREAMLAGMHTAAETNIMRPE